MYLCMDMDMHMQLWYFSRKCTVFLYALLFMPELFFHMKKLKQVVGILQTISTSLGGSA